MCLSYKLIPIQSQTIMNRYQFSSVIAFYFIWIGFYIYIENLFEKMIKKINSIELMSILKIINISIFHFSIILLMNKFVDSKNEELLFTHQAKYIAWIIIMVICYKVGKRIYMKKCDMKYILMMLILIYFIYDFTYLDYMLFIIIYVLNLLNIKNVNINIFAMFSIILIACSFLLKQYFIVGVNAIMIVEYILIRLMGDG